jgi:hypothetical protein
MPTSRIIPTFRPGKKDLKPSMDGYCQWKDKPVLLFQYKRMSTPFFTQESFGNRHLFKGLPTDYLLRRPDGEYYPCSKTAFDQYFEILPEPPQSDPERFRQFLQTDLTHPIPYGEERTATRRLRAEGKRRYRENQRRYAALRRFQTLDERYHPGTPWWATLLGVDRRTFSRWRAEIYNRDSQRGIPATTVANQILELSDEEVVQMLPKHRWGVGNPTRTPSGYRGVFVYKVGAMTTVLWKAFCRKKILGHYPTRLHAAHAFDIAAKREYGEDAILNNAPAPPTLTCQTCGEPSIWCWYVRVKILPHRRDSGEKTTMCRACIDALPRGKGYWGPGWAYDQSQYPEMDVDFARELYRESLPRSLA